MKPNDSDSELSTQGAKSGLQSADKRQFSKEFTLNRNNDLSPADPSLKVKPFRSEAIYIENKESEKSETESVDLDTEEIKPLDLNS